MPWCIHKCPYCDFNSHVWRSHVSSLPETAYLKALIADLDEKMMCINHINHINHKRRIHSVFIGGGTPSLISPDTYEKLFYHIRERMGLNALENIEITLEANPGAIDQDYFAAYRHLGINRLSLGVQSFQDKKLKSLGRIHTADDAATAIQCAQSAGFDNINIDLMFGLPEQNKTDVLADVTRAIQLKPMHLSWYQLTIEPNTHFYKKPPRLLPASDTIWDIQQAGIKQLAQHGFHRYEISAYALLKQECRHNINYWQFGDYLGIGAGAHSKITTIHANHSRIITRLWNVSHPKQYMQGNTAYVAGEKILADKEVPLEFLMNAWRLQVPVSIKQYEASTGLFCGSLYPALKQAEATGFLNMTQDSIALTDKGHCFLNDLLEFFLPT